MNYLMERSWVAKGIGATLILLLAACTSDQSYKRQVNGSDEYLKAPSLHALTSPSGMILPLKNIDYEIPAVPRDGVMGKDLDIRPPVQPLALLNGSRSKSSGNSAVIQLDNSAQSHDLWLQVMAVVQGKSYPIVSRQDAQQSLNTDWIPWTRADEDEQYSGHYQISLSTQGYQTSLQVTLLDLRQQDKPVTNPALVQRYTVEMLNSIMSGIQQLNDERAKHIAQDETVDLNVQSGTDESGLPLLVVRSSYNTVWIYLPAALARIGMKVKDSSRPLGTISMTYDAPGSGTWADLGAKDPDLRNGDYKLQVGDLGNRSTLQFIDPKGHNMTQSQNNALAEVFQAAFSQSLSVNQQGAAAPFLSAL